MKAQIIIQSKLMLALLFIITITFCKAQNNTPTKKTHDALGKEIMMISDSVAKAELKNYSDSFPDSISEGQLDLSYYDKNIEHIPININEYQVNYQYNQPIEGIVLFSFFCITVNVDTKKTSFKKEACKKDSK